ncbi:hypothetical protein [Joostella sp.]|uniref:hypothetical protein n=1 Tax=Joostella sp. TaxID=2231138 RepID=UPI003A9404D3
MLKHTHDPILGSTYYMEPIKHRVRLHSRNPLIDKKAAESLAIAAKNAVLAMTEFSKVISKVKIDAKL